MPLMQIDLNDEQSKKLEHYKILKNLKTKEEAVLDLIDGLEIEVRIKKDGSRINEVKFKKWAPWTPPNKQSFWMA